ncbi:uncharacterized protein PEZ65_012546 [Lycodopsis pacificus]
MSIFVILGLLVCIEAQGPVSPVELTVDSVDSRSSDSCNLTVTCSTQHSHISSTFRCVSRTCSQEGGERPELTTSGASLHVYLLNGAIICNHSNHFNWTKDFKMTEHFCPQYAGSSAVTTVFVKKGDDLILNVDADVPDDSLVDWRFNKMAYIVIFAPDGDRSEGSSAGTSVYLVKMVVFSVVLIIVVSAVITVHLMEKFRKHK